MNIISPLTGLNHVEKIGSIDTGWLRNQYLKKYGTDIRQIIKDIKTIEIYKCLDTDFRFYTPFHLTGDDLFYQTLSKSINYYIDWKWEHAATLPFLKRAYKILEIGCGRGGFLRRLTQEGYDVSATELNSEQYELLLKEGFSVFPDLLPDHLNKNIFYDAIVSFQVLEHIHDPCSFIQDSLNMLKTGGKFIFCVPNNDSFIKDDPNLILNMPPHHMGLWNLQSIKSIENLFPLTLDSVLYEPLQRQHYMHFLKTKSLKWFGTGFYRKWLLAAMLPVGLLYLRFFNHTIQGQSILAIYTKK